MNRGVLIRKSNSLIEASYKLSLNEQKFVLLLASKIKPSDEDFHSYRIGIADFLNFLEIRTNSYERLDQVIDSLMGKKMKISYTDEEGKQIILNVNWISSTKYAVGDDSIGIRFDPELKPFLLQLKKRFTSYRVRDVIQLRSGFSIRIYELLKQYEGLGERTIEVIKLREMLGIDPEQYSLYANFKMRVILPAQRELARKTDLSFDFEEIKEGHAVKKIRFLIQAKEPIIETASLLKNASQGEILSPRGQEFQKLCLFLPETYREQKSIRNLLMKYHDEKGYDYVLRNIEYANDGSNAVNPGTSVGRGSNYRVYLSKALAGDFGLPYKEDNEARLKTEAEAQQRAKEEAKAQKEQEAQTEKEREDLERARIYQENLSPEALETLKAEAVSRLSQEQCELLNKKTPGSGMMLKMAMSKICLERMKIS